MELRVEVVEFAEAVEVEESADGEVGTSRSIGSSVVFAIWTGAPEKQGSWAGGMFLCS